MLIATQKDFAELRKKIDEIKEGKYRGFTSMNYIDYSKGLDTIRKEYAGNRIRIEQKTYGIRVSKIKERQK